MNNEKVEFRVDNLGDTPFHDAIRSNALRAIMVINKRFKLTAL